jgi:hypothetical protein
MTQPKADKSQVEKFREAARERETDDSEEAFDREIPPPKHDKPKKER